MTRAIIGVRAALVAAFLLPGQARAHDWYTGYRDPVFDWECCGGADCNVIPIDGKNVVAERDGYHVRLSIEEAKRLNPATNLPVDGVVTWDRVIESPTGQFAACPFMIRRDAETAGLRCLFVPPNT